MEIRLVSREDAKWLSKFYTDNAEHLSPWEPIRDSHYNTHESWLSRLYDREMAQEDGLSAYFIMCNPESKQVVAVCNLTGVMHGFFQACYMGYSIAKEYEGKGYMKKLCHHAIQHAFSNLKLNRIMANHMPNNTRSEALLKSLGFTREGIARRYMFINGKWEDHVLNSIVNM